jgi:pimeloyl-ACP methyl ester carboxylesterase
VAELFHNAIGDSKLEIIVYAGHVSNMENPEKFNQAVRKFCLELENKNVA